MAGRSVRSIFSGVAAAMLAVVLSACTGSNAPKHLRPLPAALVTLIRNSGFEQTAPIFVRIFKEESELEVWKQRPDGRYALLKTYEICAWSGELGPKVAEGDRQAPEGFYTVNPGQMNPNSSYYLSFNIGYPNAYDRSLGRTGQHLMVHGACSSAGCYSMNDDQIAEIFGLAREAFNGGQRDFQVHAFPFRMTPENLANHRDNANLPFWRMLKEGYDHFEVTRRVPQVDVCDRRYVFDADAGTARFDPVAACPAYTVPPAVATAVAARQAADEQQFTMIAARLDAAATPAATMIAAATPAPAAAPLAVTPEITAALPARTATARPATPSLLDRMLGRPAAAPVETAVQPADVVNGMPTPRPNPARTRAAAAPRITPVGPTVATTTLARPAPVRAAADVVPVPTNAASAQAPAYRVTEAPLLSARIDDAFGAVGAMPILSADAVEAVRQRAR